MLDSLVRVSRRVRWNHNPNRRRLTGTRELAPQESRARVGHRRPARKGSPRAPNRYERPNAAATRIAHPPEDGCRTGATNSAGWRTRRDPKSVKRYERTKRTQHPNLPTVRLAAEPRGRTMFGIGSTAPSPHDRRRSKSFPAGRDVLLGEPYEPQPEVHADSQDNAEHSASEESASRTLR